MFINYDIIKGKQDNLQPSSNSSEPTKTTENITASMAHRRCPLLPPRI
jgi:hypothetical protein